MRTTHILLADDHQVVLDGLKALIDGLHGFKVSCMAKNGWEVLDALEQDDSIDLLMLDVSMPEMDGLECVKRLNASEVDMPIIMLSMHLSPALTKELFELGVKGYLQKDCDVTELTQALKDVRDGGTYISKGMNDLLVRSSNDSAKESKRKAPILSPRETEVLSLIYEEHSSRSIAEELGITFNTVETHRKHLLNKFGVSSTIGLIKEAMRCGLLE